MSGEVSGTAPARGVPARAVPARAVPPEVSAYLDLVLRSDADVHEHGPFTLFAGRGAWQYYARPRRLAAGEPTTFTAADVRSLGWLQDSLGLPACLEWLEDEAPTLAGAAREAGLQVTSHPLLVLAPGVEPVSPPCDLVVRLLDADDPDLPAVHAAVAAGFAGTDDVAERAAASAETEDPSLEQVRRMLRAGTRVQAGAFDAQGRAVAGAAHQPLGPDGGAAAGVSATEVVGVATVPTHRGQGAAAALTALLAHDARSRGIGTVFCSATDEAVARVYARVGFVRVGTAWAAEPCEDPSS
ncbi:GNAT family N-acetyltransferase [Nocardioides sp. GY 10127]|uniref:GNAT family N-acetyltransferase n=1 Tax=Nocardioides sp. GY 10127 TaxID=2569762 RepID=UPI0010A8CCF4|nr:GNAT family N-acetyltransferase [Nocardioides sp. GY 10127]TIC84341.1 GNAT family N-acetyltransferase [Nocardioides sp. GY 10127]